MKAMAIGMLLASPPVAAWILRAAEPNTQSAQNQIVAAQESVTPVRIPVEIVAKGNNNQVVYVEVPGNQAVPEPGVPALMALASLLLLRRHRPGGK